MTITQDSFRTWLRKEISKVLEKKTTPPPFIIWCDPKHQWKEILRKALENTFELWSNEKHELELRHKFHKTPRTPRVIYLPISREEITYFKVYEIQAEEVLEISLSEALSRYGVYIAPEVQQKIENLLPTHVKEWMDYPLSQWDELTEGNVKKTLVDDEHILEVLAGKSFNELKTEGKFDLFCRRVTEDFGLPEPREMDHESWQIEALSYFLYTEADELNPSNPPTKSSRTISSGTLRTNALKLLDTWKKRIDLISKFEALIDKADEKASLRFWAQNVEKIPRPSSSRLAELTFFKAEIEELEKKKFKELVDHLKDNLENYEEHTDSFWGKIAKEKVEWRYLLELAKISQLLLENNQIEEKWSTPADAIQWYTSIGWRIDQTGEFLFQEKSDIPGGLLGIRGKIRRAYLRHTDHINTAFSELIITNDIKSLDLEYTGTIIEEYMKDKENTAFLILDACRYELGQRLVEKLNEGEPVQRAKTFAARSTIPSITALGMPYSLPGAPSSIKTILTNRQQNPWQVSTKESQEDLTIKANRQKWLETKYKIKKEGFLDIGDVIDPPTQLNIKTLGNKFFVFGNEFDSEGHEGQLQITGAEEHLNRYMIATRKLRSIGYSRVIIITDHGFFHWEPETDEIISKPSGEILWTSRRAIVGRNLKHQTAITLPVSGSDLECTIPRSINGFKTYGGLGYFHGGATLQELIIPIVIAQWPKRARKIEVVLKPVSEITSLSQRVEIGPGRAQVDLQGTPDINLVSREIFVKVIEPSTGKIIFKSTEDYLIEPGGKTIIAELRKIEGAEAPFGAQLEILVCDADDEEILDKSNVKLKVEVDEWF